MSSHEELLSEIERQRTIVEEKNALIADSVRMVEELKKENQKIKRAQGQFRE